MTHLKVPGLQSYPNSLNQLFASDNNSGDLVNQAITDPPTAPTDVSVKDMIGGEHSQKQDSKFNMHLNCLAYKNLVTDLSYVKL